MTAREPRRIAIVGAGPGGLFLARLLHRRIPEIEVEVFERNPADAPFGFGVVFGNHALAALGAADRDVHDAMLGAGVRWETMEIRHGGARVAWSGFGMAAISRQGLLRLLRDAADEAGAKVHFEREVDPWALDGFDLVVGADGANSGTREGDAAAFGASEQVGGARYIWLGTSAPFASMTFAFGETQHGPFAVHAYPYADGESTFLVETDEATWRNAGFADPPDDLAPGESDERAIAYLEEVFGPLLEGAPLVGNNSRWLRFRTIRNRRWSSGDRVLLGDAAHTAHFSLGSGTRMAMEDAVLLADALVVPGSVSGALEVYERDRLPAVEHLQALAEPSRRWWETFSDRLRLEPLQLSFNYLTRTGALGLEEVRERDPGYAERVVDAFGGAGGDADPLCTPVPVASWTALGRLTITIDDAADRTSAEVPASALGLIVISTLGVPRPDASSIRRSLRALRERWPRVGLQVSSDHLPELEVGTLGGLDYLELATETALPQAIAGLEACRSSLPPTVALGLRLSVPPMPSGSDPTSAADRIDTSVADVVDVVRVVSAGSPERLPGEILACTERVRLSLGITTIAAGPYGLAQARTAVLAGRCDLVEIVASKGMIGS